MMNAADADSPGQAAEVSDYPNPSVVDGGELELARTQWQFGDWDSLAQLDLNSLRTHPDRAKLALLGGVGLLQSGKIESGKKAINLALNWGGDRKLVRRALLAGASNSLGRAAALAGDLGRAKRALIEGVVISSLGGDRSLIARARIEHQLNLVGLQGLAPELALTSSDRVVTARYEQSRSSRELAERCLSSPDLHETVDSIIDAGKLSAEERFLLFMALADGLDARGDRMAATHFLRQARPICNEISPSLRAAYLDRLAKLGRGDDVADIMLQRTLQGLPPDLISVEARKAVEKAYSTARTAVDKKSEHGHDLLLDWLHNNLPRLSKISGRRVLIEIGTTREDVPGQGSTAKLAEFCQAQEIHFVTVDMDPHNSRMASELFVRRGMPFEAITCKGEDYLRQYSGRMDFVFLDAYDFDHGKHSELRQSRYEKFLGNRIDEEICHRMHLDCAQSVLRKLSADGVVCVDDTWLGTDKLWTAKGTLAVPYLMDRGYTLLEARNRAVLLRPPSSSDQRS